jgi:hypothetical protein
MKSPKKLMNKSLKSNEIKNTGNNVEWIEEKKYTIMQS